MKLSSFATGFFLALLLPVFAFGAGNKPEAVTAILVEPSQNVLQIAFDVQKQFPVVLASFQEQEGTDEPYLHAWDGKGWRRLDYQSFATGQFVRVTPHRVVVASSDTPLARRMLEVAQGWGTAVSPYYIESKHYDELINGFGTALQFKNRQYTWFAQRYQLEVRDLADKRRKQSWYDQPYVDETKTPDGATDYVPLVFSPEGDAAAATGKESLPPKAERTATNNLIHPGALDAK